MKKAITVLLAVVLLLSYAATLAEGEQIYAWADQGNVQLTMVGECPDDDQAAFTRKPSGKLIKVEFTILDDTHMNSTIAMDFTKDNVKLDDFEYWDIVAPGVMIEQNDDGGFSVALVGKIIVYYDVPEDYDLSQGVLMVCGTEAAIPVATE